MTKLLVAVSKQSKGSELRLYKLIRLHVLYKYRERNCCWRKKTRIRYHLAASNIEERVKAHLRKHYPGFKTYYTQTLGSSKVIDLEADRRLEFLFTLEKPEDDG